MRVIFGTYVHGTDRSWFEYEASFERTGDDVTWIARVTSEGAFRGRPGGTIGYVGPLSDETIEDHVRLMVEASIQNIASAG